MIIDFHNHYYPPAYLDVLYSGSSAVRVTTDDDGNPRLHYPGDYNIAVPGHRDIDYRERVLIEHGFDTQVLTLTTPGTHVETPAIAARQASLVNGAFASVVKTKRGRFTALATLPLNDPRASVQELQRGVSELGFRGAMLFSNVNGIALSDERFLPLYEAADDLGAVLYIHPTRLPLRSSGVASSPYRPALVPLPPSWYSVGSSSASPEFSGRCATWVGPFPTSPSDWTAGLKLPANAGLTLRAHRAITSNSCTSTLSILTPVRSNSPLPSPVLIIFWPAATILTRSAAFQGCSKASAG